MNSSAEEEGTQVAPRAPMALRSSFSAPLPCGRCERRERARARGASGAFTLIELMVTVILVAILCVMAAPAMLEAQKSRRAYEDAASIMMLFKNARSRAIGDQSAITIIVAYDSGSNIGVLTEWESTYNNASQGNSVLAGGQATMNLCTAPSIWDTATAGSTTAAHPVLVEGMNMQEQIDADAHIHLAVNGNATGPATAFCFTPAGRMYVASSSPSVSATAPTFSEPTMAPVVFTVSRDRGLTRNVLVMPSGATRLYSQ